MGPKSGTDSPVNAKKRTSRDLGAAPTYPKPAGPRSRERPPRNALLARKRRGPKDPAAQEAKGVAAPLPSTRFDVCVEHRRGTSWSCLRKWKPAHYQLLISPSGCRRHCAIMIFWMGRAVRAPRQSPEGNYDPHPNSSFGDFTGVSYVRVLSRCPSLLAFLQISVCPRHTVDVRATGAITAFSSLRAVHVTAPPVRSSVRMHSQSAHSPRIHRSSSCLRASASGHPPPGMQARTHWLNVGTCRASCSDRGHYVPALSLSRAERGVSGLE